MASELKGVVTPLLTPFNDTGAIAESLYHAHAADMLAGGSHYLSPFGTTGEATSVPTAARMVALERLVESGTARPDQLMPGTGLAALADSAFLTRHALDLGVAAVMVLPPFFYADASDEGLYRYFATLIEDLASDRLRVCLYHIPQNTRVGISPELAGRLARDFPGIVAGYKDSSGNWENTLTVIQAAPSISVFPASEALLPQALEAGAAGCISATCNVNIRAIRALYDGLISGDGGTDDRMPDIRRIREAVAAAGLIPAMKSVMAKKTGDDRWLTCLPPLRDAPEKLPAGLEDLVGL
ncbi:dihydrodipicolinate synthase family protein [Rhodobacterales bacterium HKCCE3408]|nr:dihydrodipicolinate synthase family protein [Rhodobacterales bacterium HKCCE3408]